MDGRVETSNMDTVQDANQKVEGEEKQTVKTTAETATPPAPKAPASPEKPKAAAKPVGTSAGAKGKTVGTIALTLVGARAGGTPTRLSWVFEDKAGNPLHSGSRDCS